MFAVVIGRIQHETKYACQSVLNLLANLARVLYGRIDNLGKSDVMTTTYSSRQNGMNRACRNSRICIHSLRLSRDSYIHIVQSQESLVETSAAFEPHHPMPLQYHIL